MQNSTAEKDAQPYEKKPIYRIVREILREAHVGTAREVWAAGFRDRIVHHLVYNDIGHWYESRFIEDTFSCIPGRGTQAAQAVAKEPLSIARIGTLNSYLGMMRHTSAYTLRSKLCRVARTPTLIEHDTECTKIIKL